MSGMVKGSSLSVDNASLQLTAPVAVVLVHRGSVQAQVPQLRRARPGADLCPKRDSSGHREMVRISGIKSGTYMPGPNSTHFVLCPSHLQVPPVSMKRSYACETITLN